MIVLWILASALLAFLAILLHTLVTRWLDADDPANSMKRFWLLFAVRFMLFGLFFWQLVLQNMTTIFVCFIVFLAVYAGSLYYIIKKKPHWFQNEFKKESTLWMP